MNRNCSNVWVPALLVVVAVALAGPSAGDWPQFRGVSRDGVSSETGLLDRWPEGGPKEVWRVSLGTGYAGISVVGDRLYTMFAADHEGTATEFAGAFDATTGKELWRAPMGERYDTQFGNGPASTPTVDDETVYVLDSHGQFTALASKDGSVRWTIELTETFGSKQPHFGFSTSALVDEDLVIIEGGGAEGKSYAGLNKKSGEIVWTVGDGKPGHSSALAVKMNGKRRYVYFAGQKLRAIDADGNEIWSHDWPEGETHAMPVFVPPDLIFGSGAEGVGASLLQISEGGDGATVEEVWNTRFMRNHFSSSLVHDGYIYGFDNATLKCINAKDAKLAWAKRGFGKGSLIYADGRLVVLSDRGRLALVEATPEGYREHGSMQPLEGRCWTAPTISAGRLYLRDQTVMVAYDIKG